MKDEQMARDTIDDVKKGQAADAAHNGAEQPSSGPTTSSAPAAAQPSSAEQKNAEGKPAKQPAAGGAEQPKKPNPLWQARQQLKAAQLQVEELQAQIDDMPIYPVARPAQMRRRHWGVVASFVLMVLAPLVAVILYLLVLAQDQYISRVGFVVRSQEAASGSEFLGGLGGLLASGGSASDSDVLYAFLNSEEMASAVEDRVGLRAHFSARWPGDWAFALWPGATMEDLPWYWQRILGVSYDSSSGLIEVQATAYTPEMSRQITTAVVEEAQARLNDLNSQARADAIGYASADLEENLKRLKTAREAMVEFRGRTRIVDPVADLEGRMVVMTTLQQQLAEALISHNVLRDTLPANDPRVKNASHLIEVIRKQINSERETFASDTTLSGEVGQDYPALIAEFERLAVDLKFAEETYRVALAALEMAQADAARQSLYLATYIKPSEAQSSEYPDRFVIVGLTALIVLMVWSIATMIYYSIRDRS